MPEHYTTLTVEEYQHMKEVLLSLRVKIQKSREHLEKGNAKEALDLLKEDI